MKLERIPEYVLPAVVLLGGMLFAAAAGSMTGGGDTTRLAMVLFGILSMAGLIAINRHLWMLIPPTWFLTGRISVLPVPFALRDLMVMTVAVSVLVLIALKVFREKPRYGWVDFLMALNVVYLGTCFARNPVGFSASNSAIVGGRPYFDVIIALLAYWVLCRVRTTVATGMMVPVLCAVTASMVAVVSLILMAFPALFPVVIVFYSGFDPSFYLSQDVWRARPTAIERVAGLQDFARCGAIALFSFFPPATLLIPTFIWRFLAFALVCAALLFGGFRSQIIYVGALFFLATHFRSGLQRMILPMVLASVLLFVFVAGQGHVYELPFAAQRALSFLPGKWSYEATLSGRHSTEWRVDIWKTVLSSDRFIRNKILGDGFGMLRRDFESIQADKRFVRTDSTTRENAMIAGDYHSGPLTALKFVGVPGLVLFYALMITMAKEASKLIHRAKGTRFLPFALFVGLPIVIAPFWFTFIFGSFKVDLAEAIFSLGMLKLAQQSLEDFLKEEPAAGAAPAPEPALAAGRPLGGARPLRPLPVGARAVGTSGFPRRV